MSLMEWQFIVIHAIRETEISALLHSWVTNPPSVNYVHIKKMVPSYIFVKTQPASILVCEKSVKFLVSCLL